MPDENAAPAPVDPTAAPEGPSGQPTPPAQPEGGTEGQQSPILHLEAMKRMGGYAAGGQQSNDLDTAFSLGLTEGGTIAKAVVTEQGERIEALEKNVEHLRGQDLDQLTRENAKLADRNEILRKQIQTLEGKSDPVPFPCTLYRGKGDLAETTQANGPTELSELISKGWSETPA